jgi:hypothetical protein
MRLPVVPAARAQRRPCQVSAGESGFGWHRSTPTGYHAASMNRIVFNGREYSCPDEMPPDVRRQYDDVMASVASSEKAGSPGQPAVKIRTRFVVNGKEYLNVFEMPASIRASYEKFANRNNVATPPENAVGVSRSSIPAVTGTPLSLDAQLRFSLSTRLLLALLVVTALAALVLWR